MCRTMLLLEQRWSLLVPSSSSSSTGPCTPCECSYHSVKAIAAQARSLLHLLLHVLLLLLLMCPVLLHVLQLSSRGGVGAEQPRTMGMHASSSSSSSSLWHVGVLRCQLPLLPHHVLLLLLPLCCIHLQQYGFCCLLYCLQSIYEHSVSLHEHGMSLAAVSCSVQSG
jgi:hypothetical protein